MKKSLFLLLSLLIAASLLLSACGSAPAAPDPAEPSADAAESAAPETERAPAYEFQPKVASSYLREVFGDQMVETWFCLVDAVMAGEETFACPDQETYDWVIGQFPERCFPVLCELIDYPYDREHTVTDGVGHFIYTVPKEEAAERIAAFAEQIEGILNTALSGGETDFEKMLKLYLYYTDTYVYDYDALADTEVGYPSYLSSWRVFSEGKGICQEHSVAYAYLLQQVGVDATRMAGVRAYDGEHHQWTYVRLNGHNYHIDPTYGLGSGGDLAYFLMDDAQRETEDDYRPETFIIASNYAQEHPHPDYLADDNTFRPIWAGHFTELDEAHKRLTYTVYNENDEGVERTFDYTGF